MTSPKHISGIEMQQDGTNMVPNGPYMGPKRLEKEEKPYTDFIFPENIPEHEWNRNGA